MKETAPIGRRGSITIPAKLRRAFGIEQIDQLIAEQTPEGILPRPSIAVPVEFKKPFMSFLQRFLLSPLN